mmetsp:Transcript_10961/g.29361  ORF Transcript_10961/g.29361 Transcript_10961/m.29361 type:complete len:301 (+) Transcript_10961:603-1505(+)
MALPLVQGQNRVPRVDEEQGVASCAILRHSHLGLLDRHHLAPQLVVERPALVVGHHGLVLACEDARPLPELIPHDIHLVGILGHDCEAEEGHGGVPLPRGGAAQRLAAVTAPPARGLLGLAVLQALEPLLLAAPAVAAVRAGVGALVIHPDSLAAALQHVNLWLARGAWADLFAGPGLAAVVVGGVWALDARRLARGVLAILLVALGPGVHAALLVHAVAAEGGALRLDPWGSLDLWGKALESVRLSHGHRRPQWLARPTLVGACVLTRRPLFVALEASGARDLAALGLPAVGKILGALL